MGGEGTIGPVFDYSGGIDGMTRIKPDATQHAKLEQQERLRLEVGGVSARGWDVSKHQNAFQRSNRDS